MHTPKSLQVVQKLSMSVADAARATGFSENYIRVLMSRNTLPFVRVGRAVRVLVTDLKQFLLAHRFGDVHERNKKAQDNRKRVG